MALTDEERQPTAPEQATPGAAVLRRPVLDSGATIHVFSDGQSLRNIRYLHSPKVIRVADGRSVHAYVVGDIDMEDIKLKNVYLVPDLKMDLVSVRELAKTGIVTTFYRNHAELRRGEEVVGGAIAIGDTSLYEVRFLKATGGDACDITPEASSGSEPWRVAAVNGIREVFDCDFSNPAVDDFWLEMKHFRNSPLVRHQSLDNFAVSYDCPGLKYIEYSCLMSKFKCLHNTAVYSAFPEPKYIRYSSLVSKFCQSDKIGGGVFCDNRFRDGSVHVKAHMGPDPDGMH